LGWAARAGMEHRAASRVAVIRAADVFMVFLEKMERTCWVSSNFRANCLRLLRTGRGWIRLAWSLDFRLWRWVPGPFIVSGLEGQNRFLKLTEWFIHESAVVLRDEMPIGAK